MIMTNEIFGRTISRISFGVNEKQRNSFKLMMIVCLVMVVAVVMVVMFACSSRANYV